MDKSHVDIEERGGIAYVKLNNPKKGNSIPGVGLRKLTAYFRGLNVNSGVRVVLLTAQGDKMFCSGLDLAESAGKYIKGMKDTTGEHDGLQGIWDTQLEWSDLVRAMRGCSQPIVACVNGLAMGGGFALALASDIRFCTKNAKMNVQNIKIGLTGNDIGMSYFLPRIVGMSHAAELMYTGDFITSEKALRIGLVSEVFDTHADLLKHAEALANRMLAANPLGLGLTKQGLNLNVDSSLETALALEDRQQVMLAATPGFTKRLLKRMSKL